MINCFIVLQIKSTDFWHQYGNSQNEYILATIITQI